MFYWWLLNRWFYPIRVWELEQISDHDLGLINLLRLISFIQRIVWNYYCTLTVFNECMWGAYRLSINHTTHLLVSIFSHNIVCYFYFSGVGNFLTHIFIFMLVFIPCALSLLCATKTHWFSISCTLFGKVNYCVNLSVVQAIWFFFCILQFQALANLHKIHVRTGCFCNPGACQRHLKLTDEQLKDHFQVCGWSSL